ncbi:MAG: DUF4956 domain-containing protein [Bacteroidota bacterium]
MNGLLNILLDLEELRFLGIKLINIGDFSQFVVRFAFHCLVSLVLIRGIYYPIARRKDYLFSYLLFGAIVFILCHLLLAAGDKLKLGLALGLFAIFGIIRYRTSTIPIKEMTYLFLVTGLAVINALATKKVSYAELLFANLIIIGLTFAVERVLWSKREVNKTVLYERIELIKPERHAELLQDLRERTGLDIHQVRVGRINFLRDTAELRIYYHENTRGIRSLAEEDVADNDRDGELLG